jgi:endoglucanase
MVRGNEPGIKFDIRFIDTKTEIPGDHPWRMGKTVDENDVTWDRKWHHIHIPLTVFDERGAWDNNTWYNPEGKFDWTVIDKFEISTEYTGTTGKQIWFDNIHISNLDTAIVREEGMLGVESIREQTGLYLKVTPNPMKHSATISYTLSGESHITVSIFSVTGLKVRTLVNETQGPGNQLLTWDGCNENGTPVPRGIYICFLTASDYYSTSKIIKY